MTIKELKELIKDSADENEIFFHIQDGCCGDYLSLKIIETEAWSFKKDEPKDITILFKYLPGYKTCLQSGNTQRRHKDYMEQFNIKEDE